jgi:hypothetical protein
LLDTLCAKTAGAEAISAAAESAIIACFIYASLAETRRNNGVAVGPFHERLFTRAPRILLVTVQHSSRADEYCGYERRK